MVKQIMMVLALLSLTANYAQSQKVTRSIHSQVNSLEYKTTSIKELEDINWKDIRDIFNKNSDNDTIKLSFEITLSNLENNITTSLEVEGKTKNLTSLINKAKRGVKKIIKMTRE